MNVNEETGIPFGIISSNAMDYEVVDSLLDNGFNVSEAAYIIEAVTCYDFSEGEIEELKADYNIDVEDIKWTDDIRQDRELANDIIQELDINHPLQKVYEEYEEYEPVVTGKAEGVDYLTSWLGGQLNFIITHSPVITYNARRGSPCVPNMGVLDTLDGDYQCYDVPLKWRHKND